MAVYHIIAETARPVSAGGSRTTITRYQKASALNAFDKAVYEVIRSYAGLDTVWGVTAYHDARVIPAPDIPGASRFVIVQDIKVSITRAA